MTTKKNVLLTLMFLLTTVQVSAQDMNSTVNTMLDGWARPIYLAGMLIGLIAGLVRNYDNIAAKNDNGNRMDGVKLEGVAEIKNETETEAGTATSKDKDNADANENASAGKKSRETQKPSAKTVKAATEKLDGEIKDINMEYDKAVREIRQKEDAGSRQSALRSAGANRDRQLAKAVGQFSESSTSGKKGYDMENIIKDLRKEGVKVENMQATEWNALLKGKSISSSAGSTTRKAATKSRALMLSKTPVGYTLKAIGTTNRMSRQASADM